jgi:hypothetical protein
MEREAKMDFAANAAKNDDHELPFHPSPGLVPEAPASDSVLTLAMIERIIQLHPRSGAEALRALRTAFPDSPLPLRVAALEMLMRRRFGDRG